MSTNVTHCAWVWLVQFCEFEYRGGTVCRGVLLPAVMMLFFGREGIFTKLDSALLDRRVGSLYHSACVCVCVCLQVCLALLWQWAVCGDQKQCVCVLRVLGWETRKARETEKRRERVRGLPMKTSLSSCHCPWQRQTHRSAHGWFLWLTSLPEPRFPSLFICSNKMAAL